ncbi:MAG TPA: hypothetical protein VGK22_05465 [Candidatus Angelobacter sp.]|jgi:uncharacterized membrane protein
MKNHGKVFCLLMSACFLVAAETVAFAQDGSPTGKCSFQTLNFPASAIDPFPSALNDKGAIVGTFLAGTFRHSHGYFLYQGKFTSFMFPGSIDTTARDISGNGIIVGNYSANSFTGDRPYMVRSGAFHAITLPGFPNDISAITATGVNDNGDVVGTVLSGTAAFEVGFLLHNGKVTILSFPGAQAGTEPNSINDQGVIVGTYALSENDESPRGFMWKAGVFSNVNPPDSGGSSQPKKISNAGDIVGAYNTADGLEHGFSFDNGRYTRIDAPGFHITNILGVNKFDNIVALGTSGTNIVSLKGFCSTVF